MRMLAPEGKAPNRLQKHYGLRIRSRRPRFNALAGDDAQPPVLVEARIVLRPGSRLRVAGLSERPDDGGREPVDRRADGDAVAVQRRVRARVGARAPVLEVDPR